MNAISRLARNTMLAFALAAVPAAAYAQRDCANAPDHMKAQCETRAKAEKKCEAQKGPDRRKCMYEEMPRDCAKSDNKARCEAEVAAHKSCRAKSGEDYKRCMSEKKAG